MSRIFTVGLTGGLASGKSLVADLFARLGVHVVDTDRIARDLTGPQGRAMPAIEAAFGSASLDPSGALDRRAMRARIFANVEERRRLEAILHPMIRDEARRRLADCSGPYALLVVPLFVESGQYDSLCHRVLVVDCAPELQIQRATARDQVSLEQVRAILAAQADRATRLARADDILVNEGAAEALSQSVARLHQQYLDLAASH